MSREDRSILHLDLDRLHEVLDYDPESGELTWRISLAPNCRFDVPAGCIKGNGYRYISLDGRQYFAHQLAWLHFYQRPPAGDLDHINRKKADNRISNLREVTCSQNKFNVGKLSHNTTGFKGVSRFSQPGLTAPYRAQIRHGGKRHYLGAFTTPEAAYEAYCQKARELHGEFINLD
jgi:hypothetical protein